MTDRHWTWSDNSADSPGAMPYQSTSDWLSEMMRDAVPDRSIAEVLISGAGVQPANAVRAKALTKDLCSPQWLTPEKVRPTLASALCGLAEARHRLLDPDQQQQQRTHGVIDRLTRELGQTLLAYAAMDLLNSKVITSVRSLDVLCSAEDLMPSPVIIKLALYRAYLDERVHNSKEHKYPPVAWNDAVHAWDRDMAHAKATVKRWADLVVQGRMTGDQADTVFA